MQNRGQIIKDYYGDDYERALKSYGVDEDGFSDFYAHHNETFLNGYEIYAVYEDVKVRPLGLNQALEEFDSNNGWIKISSENNLPSEKTGYYVLLKGTVVEASYIGKDRWITDHNSYPKTTEIHGITHWHFKNKPKPPII